MLEWSGMVGRLWRSEVFQLAGLPNDAMEAGLLAMGATEAVADLQTLDARSRWAGVKELVRAARGRPGLLKVASVGRGSVSHLTGALFERAAGIELSHVAFEGAQPAVPSAPGRRRCGRAASRRFPVSFRPLS